MREKFEDWSPKRDAQRDIMLCNQIIDEYGRQGFTLTLRQIYYQMVARDYIPNNIQSYKRLGSVLNQARMAGLVDWNALEDRGRVHVLPNHWTSPAQIIRASASQFRIDKWADQPCHVEVQVEKQALEGILLPVCRRLDIGFMANKGYSSQSAMYESAQRMKRALDTGKTIHVLYLGDHDPSGIDMTRDIEDRLTLFLGIGSVEYIEDEDEEGYVEIVAEELEDEDQFDVDRLALNMDQIEEYDPPENPAKTTDSRSRVYIDRFGESSWELDALNPTILANLVTDAVEDLRDLDRWNAAVERERVMRAELNEFATSYEESH